MRRKTLQQQLREIDFIEQKVIVIFPLLLSLSVENFSSYAPPQTSRAAFDLLLYVARVLLLSAINTSL